jgi:Flp pilus assembly protein TadG
MSMGGIIKLAAFIERLSTLLRATEGSAAMEFGLIAPMLGAILLPVIDIGIGFYQRMQVQDAAQAGAQYAMTHGWNSTAIQNAVRSATTLSISASPALVINNDTSLTSVPIPVGLQMRTGGRLWLTQ